MRKRRRKSRLLVERGVHPQPLFLLLPTPRSTPASDIEATLRSQLTLWSRLITLIN